MSLENKLQELLQFAKKNNLMEMVWKDGGVKISFRRNPDAKPVAAAAVAVEEAADAVEAEPAKNSVKSPIVGTFRRSAAKGRPPMVMEGNHIKAGDVLGVVECMKIPTDVVSFCDGEINEILVEDGHAVEYGQPLFSITPGQSNGVNGTN